MKQYLVVTGAAGFIGSCMVGFLNAMGEDNLILVDEFKRLDKVPNLEGKKFIFSVERDLFFQWLDAEKPMIKCIYHLGARTDTTEFDYAIHERLNVQYSKNIWRYCTEHKIPLVYASSAATYGSGSLGYNDDMALWKNWSRSTPVVSRMSLTNGLKQEEQPPHCSRNFLMSMDRMNIIKDVWQALYSIRSTR
jgi:ADP-L-glycero-D-manno-heptose 6-epimerase